MKKCYINPQIIAYRIHVKSILDQASGVPEGEIGDEEEYDAKGFYGSWESFDDDDE